MALTPIPAGSTNWNVPLDANMQDLQNQITTLLAQAQSLQDQLNILSSSKLNLTGGSMQGTLQGWPNGDAFVTNSVARSAFFKTTSAVDHAVTVYQASTTGVDVAAALNVVSDNPQTTAQYLSGTESARGTLKIAHRNPGAGATADSSASAISIDLQYNGQGGTAARGIFVTGTDGATTGDLLTMRNNARDDFVVKATGSVGIRLATAATPGGALDIRQGDNTTVGLHIQSNSGSALQSVLVKDSGGNARFEVNANGNAVFRANMLSTAPLQMGSTTADFGGLTGSGISMKAATAVPTTNPTGGAIIYVDSSGNLLCRTQAGNVRTIAAV